VEAGAVQANGAVVQGAGAALAILGVETPRDTAKGLARAPGAAVHRIPTGMRRIRVPDPQAMAHAPPLLCSPWASVSNLWCHGPAQPGCLSMGPRLQ